MNDLRCEYVDIYKYVCKKIIQKKLIGFDKTIKQKSL